MDNEMDIIREKKEKNIIQYNKSTHSSKNFYGILSLQILNLILLILFIILLLIKEKDNKKNLSKNPINNNGVMTLSDKIRFLRLLTNNDKFEYKGIEECLLNDPDNELCIYHLISPKEVVGKKRLLLGEKYDGCYVLLDDFENIKIAYSFGISRNIQFDKALADKGIDVFMYDHTINSLPYQNPKFHWKKIGICGKNTKNNQLKDLEELIFENGHTKEKNMILKMDIEHWEWESLINLKEETLNQFKYLAIEYHFRDEKIFNDKNLYYNVLKKISKTHQAFYVRCNGDRSNKINFGCNRICHIMEVSYIIKENNIFKKDETIYPMYEFDYSKPQLRKLEMNLNLLKVFDS